MSNYDSIRIGIEALKIAATFYASKSWATEEDVIKFATKLVNYLTWRED